MKTKLWSAARSAALDFTYTGRTQLAHPDHGKRRWPGGLYVLLLLLLAGCHSAENKIGLSVSPQVQGEKVVFPKDSPQVAMLVVEPVAMCKGSTIRLNGRLLWDDDVTVRIFTPFAGRVTKILAQRSPTRRDPREGGGYFAHREEPN